MRNSLLQRVSTGLLCQFLPHHRSFHFFTMEGDKDAYYVVQKGDVFGIYRSAKELVTHPGRFQPSATRGKMAEEYSKAETQERVLENTEYTYFLEFDGASKGNPGLAGAGAVLRANDGSTVCKLQEGVGIATCLSALLAFYIQTGVPANKLCSTQLRVQGLWKLKNPNMAKFCKVAKELKDKFVSFEISHFPRKQNSDADALANRAVHLQDGVVVEDCMHK